MFGRNLMEYGRPGAWTSPGLKKIEEELI